jgi:hypothetical protein
MGKSSEAGNEAVARQPQDRTKVTERQQHGPGAPGMDAELQAHIGRHLKAAYDDVLNQPVPDRFHHLLEALEKREADHDPQDENADDGRSFRPR